MLPQVNITLITGPTDGFPSANFWRECAETQSIIARFWSFTRRDPVTGCLRFIGHSSRGYGVFGVGRRRIKAHRFAWLVGLGEIPHGLEVCHHCDVTACVDVAHLFLGTHRQNHLDAVRKGRKNAWGFQKLNAQQVLSIRSRVAAGELQYLVAQDFAIARNTVSQIVHGKTWAHLHREVSA